MKCPLSYHAFNFTSQQGFCASHIQTRAASSERSNQGTPIRAVPVKVAHELLNAGHRYLDVRTAEEFASGHIEGAVNIPYMYKAGLGLTKNVTFLEDVAEKFGKDDEVVVGCQMGKRSQMAADELVAAGYTGITDMAGGYLAWRQSGMPTKVSV
uniref:High arsenic content 2 n=1 Tax=Pteris vittata TaxID=13821 RepID=A0A7G4WFQ7_PTEVI|nr:high arsenic content 2 [Pteris vittata]